MTHPLRRRRDEHWRLGTVKSRTASRDCHGLPVQAVPEKGEGRRGRPRDRTLGTRRETPGDSAPGSTAGRTASGTETRTTGPGTGARSLPAASPVTHRHTSSCPSDGRRTRRGVFHLRHTARGPALPEMPNDLGRMTPVRCRWAEPRSTPNRTATLFSRGRVPRLRGMRSSPVEPVGYWETQVKHRSSMPWSARSLIICSR
jgi:hypothetical protein